MGALLKKWFWVPLWAISIVLMLTMPRDLLWARALMIAPAMASLVLLVLAMLKKDRRDA